MVRGGALSWVGVALGLITAVYFSMKDGRLLKPTHPAMSLDSTILQRALGKDGPVGTVTAAFTEVHITLKPTKGREVFGLCLFLFA